MGVIPDPEIIHVQIKAPQAPSTEGDAFIIVASDGVWEFISSQEACDIVARYENATDSCTALVKEARPALPCTLPPLQASFSPPSSLPTSPPHTMDGACP